MSDQQIEGIIQAGYGVASGTTDSSPYPKGTIEMQAPFFRALGLDLAPFFPGTLNINISPKQFQLVSPQYTFRNVQWAEGFAPEDFSFTPCQIIDKNKSFDSLIYYPHPETKIGHFQNPSIVEVIAPLIPDLKYGDRILLSINTEQVRIFEK
ncbi:MAG: CTP-dependent riboflavin kinase [Plectolyngbya sp. WJT66-NPBG17]|jgi:CTP-dependent riboflavin kinase|nr:CTP-dependent riboflavin kinase [Plectolyngbya sp. WJT66-NPBG17]